MPGNQCLPKRGSFLVDLIEGPNELVLDAAAVTTAPTKPGRELVFDSLSGLFEQLAGEVVELGNDLADSGSRLVGFRQVLVELNADVVQRLLNSGLISKFGHGIIELGFHVVERRLDPGHQLVEDVGRGKCRKLGG